MKSVVELEINAPKHRVAALFADPNNNTRWMDDLEKIEKKMQEIAQRVAKLPGMNADAFLEATKNNAVRSSFEPEGVANLEGLSAHADYEGLLRWMGHFRRSPKRTFVTHGEPAAADELRRRIGERLGWEAEVPEYQQSENLS